MVKIFPSLLAADFTKLDSEVKKIEKNVDGLHLDVMDGHFVPNISFGFPVIKSLRDITDMYFDAHLMITNPDDYLEEFSKYVNGITVHIETVNHLNRTISRIKELGCDAGVSINPHTPVCMLEEIIKIADRILVMSVNPGFTGQKFIESTYDKIEKVFVLSQKYNPNIEIQIDGGVNVNNIKKLTSYGANSFVVGAAVFHQENSTEAAKNLKKVAEEK